MTRIKVIISGGGTGGHIFPAIAIANALKNKAADIDILFVGAVGRMEMEKVPKAGYRIIGLKIAGFQRKLTLKNLSFPFKLICSLIKARKILNDFMPDVVVGVGGYASGPLLRAATGKGIPSLIQEQNSFPGVTNKLLAAKVNKICVAYDNLEKFFPKEKIYFTGNPIRQDVINISDKRPAALKHFGLSADKLTLLVVGGSLGSRTINESISDSLTLIADNNLQLVWQTGKQYIETAKKHVANYENKGIKAFDFINEMDLAYAAADIVVSRAGAIAISELCAVKKPVILVPSPNVAEDHQTKNAMALVNKNAAIMVKDIDAGKLLGKSIIDLYNNKNLQQELIKNIAELAVTDASDRIAEEVLSLVKK